MNELSIDIEIPNLSMILQKHESESFRRKLLRILAARYRAFCLRSFDQNSRGGKAWAPLKDSTAKRRRKGIKVRSGNAEQARIQSFFSGKRILVDTGILRGALNPTLSKGSYEKISLKAHFASADIGFSTMPHPGPKSGKGGVRKPVTISQLAKFHHSGSRKTGLPARPILIPPDSNALRQFEKIIENEEVKLWE